MDWHGLAWSGLSFPCKIHYDYARENEMSKCVRTTGGLFQLVEKGHFCVRKSVILDMASFVLDAVVRKRMETAARAARASGAKGAKGMVAIAGRKPAPVDLQASEPFVFKK
jgi:hypothetical protein